MKQSKVKDYRPNYPRKFIKGAILATAAAVALAGTTGCELRTGGVPMPEPTPGDELVLDGEVALDPGEDELELGGAPLPDESFDDVDDSVTRDDEPALQGKIVVPEDTENP